MDRRELISGIIASGAVFSQSIWATPANAQFMRSSASARQAIRSLHLSILLSLAIKNNEGARRQALRLAEYSNVDPNWYTYQESFSIAVILYKLTPEANEKEWLFAAEAVVQCLPGINGDTIENMRILARATEGLLQAAQLGKLPKMADKKADLSSLLVLFAGAAFGTERVRWAKAAITGLKSNNAEISEDWSDGGGSLRLYAATLGVAGDWLAASQLHQRMLAAPEVKSLADVKGKGSTGGFLSFYTGRESFDAEVATGQAMAGRLDEAMVTLERARRLTPSLARRGVEPAAAEVLKTELQLATAGIVLATVVCTVIGTLVIISTSLKGKIRRTVHFDPQFGGYTLPSRTVNSGAFHFKRDGLLPSYQKARRQKNEKQLDAVKKYIGVAAANAEDFVGRPLRLALAKAKIPANADLLIVLPGSLAFLPTSMSASSTGTLLGNERQLRFVDSLASIRAAQETAANYKAGKQLVRIMALDPAGGGPSFSRFEGAGVGVIGRKAAAEVTVLPLTSDKAMQWPADGGYWHISSHASWNSDKPELSGILLGGKRVATLEDVKRMTLSRPPRLVFLSCCETALLNTREKLDKFLSLPTAFLSLGCGGVVASHWPVSDAASALLSMRFYEEHLVLKKRPADALASAQRWLAQRTALEFTQYLNGFAASDAEFQVEMGGISSLLLQMEPASRPYSEPFYWGGFQLYGT